LKLDLEKVKEEENQRREQVIKTLNNIFIDLRISCVNNINGEIFFNKSLKLVTVL